MYMYVYIDIYHTRVCVFECVHMYVRESVCVCECFIVTIEGQLVMI